MNKIAVVYHSAHGHTRHIATHVVKGARGIAGSASDERRSSFRTLNT